MSKWNQRATIGLILMVVGVVLVLIQFVSSDSTKPAASKLLTKNELNEDIAKRVRQLLNEQQEMNSIKLNYSNDMDTHIAIIYEYRLKELDYHGMMVYEREQLDRYRFAASSPVIVTTPVNVDTISNWSDTMRVGKYLYIFGYTDTLTSKQIFIQTDKMMITDQLEMPQYYVKEYVIGYPTELMVQHP